MSDEDPGKTACEVTRDRPDKPGCRTCAMAMLVSWYMDELRDAGFNEQAALLETKALDENNSPEDVCKVMEDITNQVDAGMKKRIGELNAVFDHHAKQVEEEEGDDGPGSEE